MGEKKVPNFDVKASLGRFGWRIECQTILASKIRYEIHRCLVVSLRYYWCLDAGENPATNFGQASVYCLFYNRVGVGITNPGSFRQRAFAGQFSDCNEVVDCTTNTAERKLLAIFNRSA